MKTPNDEKDLLYETIQDLKSQIKVEVEDENKTNEISKAYLGFLSFCISENLSFSNLKPRKVSKGIYSRIWCFNFQVLQL